MSKRISQNLFALVAVVTFAAATYSVAEAATKKKCVYFGYNGATIASMCYTMNVTWSDGKVKCNSDGSASYSLFKSGYSWTSTGLVCEPKTYSSSALGWAHGDVTTTGGGKVIFDNKVIYCSAHGDEPDEITCWLSSY